MKKIICGMVIVILDAHRSNVLSGGIELKKKPLSTLLGFCSLLMVLMVMPFIAACTRPAEPAGPAPSPPAIQSVVSFRVVPTTQVISAKNSITFFGAGLTPGEELQIFIRNETRAILPLETEVTYSCEPEPKVNQNGAFQATLNLDSREPGLYTVALIGRDGKLLATAPLELVPAKK